MKLTFDISATEFVIVRDILADIVPTECRVWVFGSRAKNQARFNSDLDMALECKDKLPPVILHMLKEAFSDSRLPYRVDVLDINDVSENFQTIIRPQAIAFPLAKSDKVPFLRFPEFSGEWGIAVLGEVANFRRGSFPQPYGLPKWYDDENGYPFVQVFDVGKNFRLKPKTKRQISELATEKSVFVPKNSIVLTIQGSIGRIAITQYDAYVDRTLLIFQSFTIPVDEQFFAQVIYLLFEKERRLAPGGTIKTITKEVLSHFKFRNPTLPEQQKIASFLSAIDTKIAQITKKKALLEQYKKGVTQNLFSQELRFKDAQGKAFPEWVEKRLGEVAEKTASTVTAQSLGKTPGEYPVFGASGIAGYVDFYNSKIPHISVVKDGAGVGRVFLCPEKSSVLGTLDSIVAKAGNITGFVYYWLAKISFEPYKTGSTIPHVYYRDYSKKKSLFPKNVEQQKIANFLSAIDQKIDLVDTELAQTKTFKKGLLQQMFV